MMDEKLKEVLQLFAKKNELNPSTVDDFLLEISECQTLNDVLNLPYELQSHSDWMPEEPIKGYVMENWFQPSRHMTIDVESIVEMISDTASNIFYENEEFDLKLLTKSEIESLSTTDEDVMKQLQELKGVALQIIDEKYGSSTLDW
ncbi:hypothetical protein [Rossellomorea marisflavi]|uniref:hypothetical protein n=1 Tax=Rossellomorea marisflavi TaxID=189381 RepID=UPI003FA04E5B